MIEYDHNLIGVNDIRRCVFSIGMTSREFHKWASEHLPHQCPIVSKERNDIDGWILKHTKGLWANEWYSPNNNYGNLYYFEDRNDALMFKLRWGGV